MTMRSKLTEEERARLTDKTTILIDALKEANQGQWYSPGDTYSDEINREKLSPEAKRIIPEDWNLGMVQSTLYRAQQFRDWLSAPDMVGQSIPSEHSDILEVLQAPNSTE